MSEKQTPEQLLDNLLAADPASLPKTDAELTRAVVSGKTFEPKAPSNTETPGDEGKAGAGDGTAAAAAGAAPKTGEAAKAGETKAEDGTVKKDDVKPDGATPARGPLPKYAKDDPELPAIDLAKIPEDQRSAVEAYTKRLQEYSQLAKRSQRQTADVQRELAGTKNRLAQLEQQIKNPAPAGAVKPAAQAATLQKLAEKFNSPQFKELEQDYPVVAALREVLTAQADQLTAQADEIKGLKSQVTAAPRSDDRYSALEARLDESDRVAALNRIEAKHPDALNHLEFNADGSVKRMSPDFATFWWSLEDDIRNEFDPTSYSDVERTLDQFKEWLTPPKTSPDQTQSHAQNGRREALAIGVTPKIRGPASGKPAGFEGLSTGQLLKQFSSMTPEQTLEALVRP